MSWTGRFWRQANPGRAFPRAKASTRDVDAFLAKVTAEAWGPLDTLPKAEARQRIAEQKARDFGLGQLV
jgi:hypothetical protein